MEQLFYMSALFDLYGSLLTEKQQECLRLHLYEDFSLSETGEALGISRQGAYDMIHRARQTMEEYESRLGLVERMTGEHQLLKKISSQVEALKNDTNAEAVEAIRAELQQLMGTAGSR